MDPQSPKKHQLESNGSDGDHDERQAHRSTKKPKTVVDIQRNQIEKLMERIDIPISLPSGSRSSKPKLKPPPEIVRNVQGSSAGAGSGEFHIYRALRRKEQMRLKVLDEEAKEEQERKEYEEKMRNIREEEERKTAKKREKRRKRNQRKSVKSGPHTNSTKSEDQNDSGAEEEEKEDIDVKAEQDS